MLKVLITRYEAAALAVVLLMAWVPHLPAQSRGSMNMNGAITATLQSSERQSYLHGPVPVTVTVSNVSTAPLSILLAYPVPETLRFESDNLEIAAQKRVAVGAMARTAPIDIAPGAQYTATYYLNRYFEFRAAGLAIIDWHLTIPFTQGDNPTATPEFQGSFRVELVLPREPELRDKLAHYAMALQSPDLRTKMQAAEALAFLDTEISSDYVLSMLGIDNLEIIGIHALGRNTSRQHDARIVQMLSHRDSGVVGAALEEIDRHRVPVPRSTVQLLLSAENPNTQWLALGWLAQRPRAEDLPLLSPLVASPNDAVRDRATAYERLLKTL